jgi:hypothetical protein
MPPARWRSTPLREAPVLECPATALPRRALILMVLRETLTWRDRTLEGVRWSFARLNAD